MQQLEDLVLETVQGLMQTDTLFTALDVSNKVKEVMANARHREVRDLVRALYKTEIAPKGWSVTDINVTLPDGSSAVARLYHPLSAMYDLDYLYQNRAQASARPDKAPLPATVGSDGTVTVTTTPSAVPAPAAVVAPSAKDLWANMFQSQPSLFPLK